MEKNKIVPEVAASHQFNGGPGIFIPQSEEEKLWRDMNRSPQEKLHLFTKMIKRNRIFKKGTTTY